MHNERIFQSDSANMDLNQNRRVVYGELRSKLSMQMNVRFRKHQALLAGGYFQLLKNV